MRDAERLGALARAVASRVETGMTVGLGTGSSADAALREIGRRAQAGLAIRGVPTSRRTAKLARELGIRLVSLEEVDRIDLGIDVLNPVQPECMDFGSLHARHGGRLSFHGAIGTQTTMPFGTPEEVAATVRRNLAIAGPEGGLLVAPTHMLEPEVPWANIEAFIEACAQWKP